VGQLLAVEWPSGRGVEPLEAQEREAALACVAVQVPGEVQARAAIEIEGLDILALPLAEWRFAPPAPERTQRRVVRVRDRREACVERRTWIVEHEREQPVLRRAGAIHSSPPRSLRGLNPPPRWGG